MPARSKAAELSRIIEKIFNERCGFSVHCQIHYKEIKRKEREEDIIRIPHPAESMVSKERRIYLTLRRKAAVEAGGARSISDMSDGPKLPKDGEAGGGSVARFPEAAKREESGEASSEKGTGRV